MPNQYSNAHKYSLRYRVSDVRFRNDGMPFINDIRNLAKDCGVEVYCEGKTDSGNWGCEIPRRFLGIPFGTKTVDFGSVGEERAFLAAILGTRRGARIMSRSIR